MAVDHVKSTPITDADATPVVAHNSGAGAPGDLREITGSAVAVASSSVGATYRMCRVPTNAKVKRIVATSQAQGAGKFDIGVYYPTTGITGKADLAANAISQAFFAHDVDFSSAVQPTGYTNQSGTYTADLWNQPLWQALGLTSDPSGFFDIVFTVDNTAVTTGTGIMGCSVEYVM